MEDRITLQNCDFAGWATRRDLLCTDGRTIRKDAFKHCDGKNVPLFWNHQHEGISNVLGKATLEHRDEGVYAYGKFNDTEDGIHAKKAVMHGDVRSLSIFANSLKQLGMDVIHGTIRELSLVPAGANPGAFIDFVVAHGEDGDDGFVAGYDENLMVISHADKSEDNQAVKTETSEELTHNDKEDNKMAENTNNATQSNEKTIKEIIDTMNEEQKNAMYALIGKALEEGADDEVEHSEGGYDTMKTNVFDNEAALPGAVLTHADQRDIIALAKQPNIGNLKTAMEIYAQDNEYLAHGLDLGDTDVLEELLPDHKLLNPGAPEILGPDQSWVMNVIKKIHKSPYSRVRTRHADARIAELKAKGYKKGEEKKFTNNIKLIGRSFDPQTIYIKDKTHRDDIVDITEFDHVAYIWNMMNGNMYETLALAALVGDGREETDPDKIKEDHVCPIWHDDELYTIHRTVDFEAMKDELQGTNTSAYFSENYIYAEAIIQEALYAREKFKGSGRPDFYCTPHLVNIMLLARDMNGRRIYDSKADLAKALNVNEIFEIEQLEGRTRTDDVKGEMKLLGLFVNLADYQFGSTKGGEVTKFTDFNIDFNTYTYLMETRLSGGLVKPFAAIALEVPVSEAAAG